MEYYQPAMRKLTLFALATCVFTASSGLAQESKLGLGIGGGAYFPTDPKTKRLLGNTWLNFSIAPTKFKKVNGREFDSDLQFVTRDKNGNRLTMVFLTYGLRTTLGSADSNSPTKPYFAVRGGPVYLDYRITDTKTYRAKRLGVSANAELGVDFSDTVRATLRYDVLSKYDTIKFDGFSVNLLFKLGRF